MLILSATKILTTEVRPYKDFNSSVNCSALVIINGKLMSGRIIFKNNESGEIELLRGASSLQAFPFSEFMVKESDIIGVVMKDLSEYDYFEIMEGD